MPGRRRGSGGPKKAHKELQGGGGEGILFFVCVCLFFNLFLGNGRSHGGLILFVPCLDEI